MNANMTTRIDYGVQRADGSGVLYYSSREFAEHAAPMIPGDVVYRTGNGPWQRAATIIAVDRADLEMLLVAFRTLQEDVPDLDPIMREAHRGIVARIERNIGNGLPPT